MGCRSPSVSTLRQHGSVNTAERLTKRKSILFGLSMKLFNIVVVARLMRIARMLPACMFLLLSVTAACALDPDRSIHQFAHRSWGEKEGYPGRTRDLAQTTDGFLWMTTDKGLFRFDGVHFEPYEPRSGDKLSAGRLRGLLALPDGSLWFAYLSETKICVLRDGNLKCYDKGDGITSYPAAIVQDHEGIVWANTESGVIRFNGTRWEHIGKEWNFPEEVSNNDSIVLFVDSHGTLWAGVNHTVVYLKQGSKRFEPTGTFAVLSFSIAEAQDGTIWLADNFTYARAIGTSGSMKSAAMTKCAEETPEGGSPKCLKKVPPALKIGGLVRLLFDHSGSLWMTSNISGVFRIPHPQLLRDQPISKARGVLQAFASKDGLSADDCHPILEDREGNIWVGTREGLDQFRDTTLVPIPLPTSIFQTAIAPADSGGLWIVGSFAYVARIRADSSKISFAPVAEAFKPYRDPAGVTWLIGNSLEKWKDGRFLKVAEAPYRDLGSSGFWQVARDKFGTLWAFFDGLGFFSLDDRRWKAWATPPEVAKEHATNIYSDSTGRIWVSTYEGDIITMDRGSVVDYPHKPDSHLRYVEVFAERSPQEIWAGGEGGLALIKREHLLPIRPVALNSLENVTGIVDAGSDGLWLNTSDGVIHITSDEVDRALRDPSYRFQCERFDSSDGLPGQSDAYPYPKAVQGTDGRIWFTATRGVAWIDPKNRKDLRNVLPPPVSITSMSADGSLHLLLTNLRLPPHTANVQINYTALSLSVPERVHFRYMLEGSDNTWLDVGTRREAFYTNLGPRHYRFRVIACNSDGVWNNVGASIEFTIAPAWYQTSWFFVMCIIAALLLVFAIYRIRVRQIASAIGARFDERLDERTRIARDFHDTLLQTIQGSKLVADSALKRADEPLRMREALEHLSKWLARATTEGRTALNSLRTSTTETNDLAESFRRAIEECRLENPMEASFSTVGDTREMHPIVRDEVYRIGYEAIRNVCVHSMASKLQVTLTYAEELTVDIADNGVGMDPVVADRGKDGHFGLQGMRERASRIAGKLTVTSSPQAGTEVKLVVPGKIIYRKRNPGKD